MHCGWLKSLKTVHQTIGGWLQVMRWAANHGAPRWDLNTFSQESRKTDKKRDSEEEVVLSIQSKHLFFPNVHRINKAWRNEMHFGSFLHGCYFYKGKMTLCSLPARRLWAQFPALFCADFACSPVLAWLLPTSASSNDPQRRTELTERSKLKKQIDWIVQKK